MNSSHFLTIEKYHLSRKEAEKAVEAALKHYGCRKPIKGNWGEIDITISNNKNGQTEKFKFHQLVTQARLSGIALEILQRQRDNEDPFFGGSFSLATPNHQLEIAVSFAGTEKKLKGPCRIAPVEQELAEDILFYKQQVCQYSNSDDFSLSCRYYRSYIFSCISLVESFINRHILIFRTQGIDSTEFQALEKTLKLEDKIDLWLKIFSNRSLSAINGTKEWNDFKLLQRERNMLTHAVEPFYGHQIKEIADYLNFSRTGIGGLLNLLRITQNLKSLGFIERLRTAPKIKYEQVTLKAENENASSSRPDDE
jgi:hypothetical protein